MRINAESKLRGRMSHQLLTNGNIYAAFRAPGYKSVSEVMQFMSGTKFLESLADIIGGIIENAFGVFGFVAGAAFLFRLFKLSLQDRFNIVRQKDMAVTVGSFSAFDEDKAFRFVNIRPFKSKCFRTANARIDVKEHEPANPERLQTLKKGLLFGESKRFSAFFGISDTLA